MFKKINKKYLNNSNVLIVLKGFIDEIKYYGAFLQSPP